MAARFAEPSAGLDTVADDADAFRGDAVRLADVDVAAYAQVLAAGRSMDASDRSASNALRSALAHASDVPLAMAECAEHVAVLGARVAAHGNANVRGDAVTAVVLADAVARSAAQLVRINVARLARLIVAHGDENRDRAADRVEQVMAHCAATAAALQAATEGRT